MSEVVNGVVYLLTCLVSGKQYVGQTWNYEKRMSQYRRGEGAHAIGAAIKKHGWNNFTVVKIVQGVQTQEWLSKIETGYIKAFNTIAPNGYNLTTGGEGGKPSVETRKKISESKRGEKNPNFGKSPSPETRAKQSDAMRGKPKSPEHRAKLREAHLGKSLSPETRAKMSVSQLARHARERKSTATASLL